MSEKALTRDMVDNPALWRLSLLLCANSLEVAAVRTTGEADVISASIPLSAESSFEEAIYANPLLLAPFGKIDIVVTTPDCYILPADTVADSAALDSLEQMMCNRSVRTVRYTDDIDSRNGLMFRLEHRVANFLTRTFGAVVPRHRLAVLAQYFSHKSRLGNTGKVYVNLRSDSADVVAYDSMGLVSLATYHCPDIADASYYVLAAIKSAGLDPAVDEILIAGDPARRAALSAELRRFANCVMPAVFPSALYHASAGKLPFELVILPLCE
jgi:hypothetical protein